jgi:hypothetical protein
LFFSACSVSLTPEQFGQDIQSGVLVEVTEHNASIPMTATVPGKSLNEQGRDSLREFPARWKRPMLHDISINQGK